MNGVHLGIIGCGAVAARHVARLVEDSRVRIVVLCDPRIESAQALADGFALDAVLHHDATEAIGHPDLDAVLLCSPTQSHYEQTCQALSRGRHVLSEKPLAMRSDQVRDLIGRRDVSGCILGVSFQRRFEPVYRTARSQLQKNRAAYGKVNSIHVFVCERWAQTITGTWRDDPDVSGGYFADAGSHQIDACAFISGLMPRAVRAETESRGANVSVVTRVHARLEGDAWLSANFVGDANHWREDILFHCEHADLALRNGNRMERWTENRMTPFIYLENDSSPDREFVEAICRRRRDPKEEPTFDAPAEAALVLAEWTEAVQRSAASGEWVELGG